MAPDNASSPEAPTAPGSQGPPVNTGSSWHVGLQWSQEAPTAPSPVGGPHEHRPSAHLGPGHLQQPEEASEAQAPFPALGSWPQLCQPLPRPRAASVVPGSPSAPVNSNSRRAPEDIACQPGQALGQLAQMHASKSPQPHVGLTALGLQPTPGPGQPHVLKLQTGSPGPWLLACSTSRPTPWYQPWSKLLQTQVLSCSRARLAPAGPTSSSKSQASLS